MKTQSSPRLRASLGWLVLMQLVIATPGACGTAMPQKKRLPNCCVLMRVGYRVSNSISSPVGQGRKVNATGGFGNNEMR
ncbi:hypothetical protein [Paraburkholderia sp. BR10879]|uniref:hypothetical protein n=1 Tax=Paraburkholderia sp. BR10879 TaxID=3236990 RepID=UPI00397E1DBE